ncbi:hypothetical protein GCM10009555_058450 [Acrocarpospora macrocephala]|uniref:Uncharacterized protein n=1 Tax=Acrocarpospora macrocephala TaxID=150177 RepID=A0A5M3WTE1_9ACTN|nr:hypothetical protein Amac_055270 [Acrocarpospora macrocephala]
MRDLAHPAAEESAVRRGPTPGGGRARGSPLLPRLGELEDRTPGAEARPEQVVRITIGRVEVRAAPAAAPARQVERRQERRVMSLEEYLERRARGGGP